MRRIKIAVRIVSAVITAVFALIFACNMYFIAARAITGEQHPTLFGYSTAIVISGSMSGTIEVDDMVLIQSRDTYASGDIITYNDGNHLVTHRIAQITDNGHYITKGDANNSVDTEAVSPDCVVGCVVLIIPKIGKLVSALKTPVGMCCMVLIGILLIEYPALLDKIRAKKDGENYVEHNKK